MIRIVKSVRKRLSMKKVVIFFVTFLQSVFVVNVRGMLVSLGQAHLVKEGDVLNRMLHVRVNENDTGRVRELLRQKADVNSYSSQGSGVVKKTPLCRALEQRDCIEMVKLLVE